MCDCGSACVPSPISWQQGVHNLCGCSLIFRLRSSKLFAPSVVSAVVLSSLVDSGIQTRNSSPRNEIKKNTIRRTLRYGETVREKKWKHFDSPDLKEEKMFTNLLCYVHFELNFKANWATIEMKSFIFADMALPKPDKVRQRLSRCFEMKNNGSLLLVLRLRSLQLNSS